MTRINPLYLNELSYINYLIDRILFELSSTYSNHNYNPCYEAITRLFSSIRKNSLSNLHFFYNTVFENDLFGFSDVKRNLRYNIEAYIDIYNITNDITYNKGYLYLLKLPQYRYLEISYKNEDISKDDFDYNIKLLDFNKNNYYQFIDNYKNIKNSKKYLSSFSSKCTIAHCNGLYKQNVEKYEKYFKEFSHHCHPNIFINSGDIYDRIIESKDLLLLHLEILIYSLNCLISYTQNLFENMVYNNINYVNMYALFNTLGYCISNFNYKIYHSNNITINNWNIK